jgi:AcrR family transcriptional regulator
MSDTLDWNAKTIAEFRANEGRVGGNFDPQHPWARRRPPAMPAPGRSRLAADTGQQRGQLPQRIGDGNGVLVLAPPGDLPVPDPQHADERNRGAAAGSGHGPGQLILHDDHLRVRGVVDRDLPALLEPHRQSSPACLGERQELLPPPEPARPARWGERLLDDSVGGEQAVHGVHGVAEPLLPHAREDLTRPHRGPRPPAQAGQPGSASALRADARRNRARILAAAEEVFSEQGASASTEEVARRAGVAIGTVFRHFPAKDDLLRAIMKDLLQRLTGEVTALAAEGDPSTALFAFFTRIVAQAAAKKAVIDLLARTGTEIQVTQPVQDLRDGVAELLAQAQRAGTVRDDAQITEVMALLTSTCQGALQAGWDSDLQRRTLTVIFDGLRPVARPRTTP